MGRYATAALFRRIMWALLALAPVTILVDKLAEPGDTLLFLLAAASLVPLAWLIGEATEHAGEHPGPGIGGLLNASFGNAPELVTTLLTASVGLPDVVRGSLAGRSVSTILLVVGLAIFVGGAGELDRRSLALQ